MELIVPKDCGNAPRKLFLRDFNVAYAEGDQDFVLGHLTDDVVWRILGQKHLEGRDAFAAHLAECGRMEVTRLTLRRLITHGREAAVEGEMVLAGETVVEFCDLYTFQKTTGTLLKRIDSYAITGG